MNFVCCHPVGRAVEALQACLGYRRADPDRRIGVVLKANTAVELAGWCEFIDEVCTVDVDVFTPPAGGVLDHIPRKWTGSSTTRGVTSAGNGSCSPVSPAITRSLRSTSMPTAAIT